MSQFCQTGFIQKSCCTTFESIGFKGLLGVCRGNSALAYLQTHLDSNSGPLHNTHGQLYSILWCYSWFHCRKQAIPWYKPSCWASAENWVYSVFGQVTNRPQVCRELHPVKLPDHALKRMIFFLDFFFNLACFANTFKTLKSLFFSTFLQLFIGIYAHL